MIAERIREMFITGDYTLDCMLAPLEMETRQRHTLSQIVRGELLGDSGGPRVPADPFAAWRDDPDGIITVILAMRSEYPDRSITEIASRYRMVPLHARKVLSGEIARHMPGKHVTLVERPCHAKGKEELGELYKAHGAAFLEALYGKRGKTGKPD